MIDCFERVSQRLAGLPVAGTESADMCIEEVGRKICPGPQTGDLGREETGVGRLTAGLTEAEKIGEFITTDRTVLDVPTTATLTLGALWVVNTRFSTPPELDTPYWITRLPTQP